MAYDFDSLHNSETTYEIRRDVPINFEVDPETFRQFQEGKKKIELLLNGNAVFVQGDPGSLFGQERFRWTGMDAETYLTIQEAFRTENPVDAIPVLDPSKLPSHIVGGETITTRFTPDGQIIHPEEPAPEGADEARFDPLKSEAILAFTTGPKIPFTGGASGGRTVPGELSDQAYRAIGEIFGIQESQFGPTIGNHVPLDARPNALGANHLINFRNENPGDVDGLRALPAESQIAALQEIARYIHRLAPTGFGYLDQPTRQQLFDENVRAIINLYEARVSDAVNSNLGPDAHDAGPIGPVLPLREQMQRIIQNWDPPEVSTEPGSESSSDSWRLDGEPVHKPWEYEPWDPLSDPEWRATREELREAVERLQQQEFQPFELMEFPELPFQRYARLMREIEEIAGPEYMAQWEDYLSGTFGLRTMMGFYTEGMSADMLMGWINLFLKGVPEHVVVGAMRGDSDAIMRWFDNSHPAATLEPSERREQAEQEIERRLNDPKSPFDNEDWRRYQEAFPDIAEELYRLAAGGADPAAVAEAVQQLLRGFVAAHNILSNLRNSGAGGERGGPPGAGGPETVAGAPDDPGAGSSLSEQTRAAIDALRNTDLEAFVREYSELQRLAPRPGAPDVSDRINPNLLRPFFDIEAFIRSDAGAVEAPGLNRLLEGLEGQYDTPETLTRLLIQSMIDPITGLPNINAAALYLNPNDDAAALSLGGLKYINTFSHILGDGYIASIGRFLAQQIRDFMPEAFGDTVNLFYSSGTDFVLTGPPDLLPHVIARLHDVFSSQPWFGISENEETGLVNPGMVSNMFRLDRLWQDVQAAGGDLDTLIRRFEGSYRGARGLLDELKPGAENYPARGEDLLQRVEDPENFVGILPVIPDLIPPTPGSSRSDATQQLRERFDQLRAELEGLPQEALEAFRNELLGWLFTNPRYPQLLNNRVEFSLPRDEQGNIVPGYGVLSGDVATLGGLNNVSWDAGDLVIGFYERRMAEIALLFPDLTILKIGGDEATMYGPMEALEAARDYLQQAMASARIMFPNPENPEEMLTIDGLSAQVGILPFSEDGTPPDPEELENEVLDNKIEQQFRLRILREDNSLFYEGPPPPQSDANPSP